MLLIAGYFLALLMGLTLGLLGAGGSILTVPILVYFFRLPTETATGYSLLIVGITAFSGAWRYCLLGTVRFKDALIFAIPAMLVVRYTRGHIVPSLPPVMFHLPKDDFILVLFALLMLAAALFMFRPLRASSAILQEAAKQRFWPRLLLLLVGSACVGLLTGLVGAGGGFLIIPTLIGLFRLSVKEAIGTSLAIISMNSLVGFGGDLTRGIVLDWPMLLMFLALTSVGMWAGTSAAQFVEARKLRRLFGWFVLLVGVAMLADRIF